MAVFLFIFSFFIVMIQQSFSKFVAGVVALGVLFTSGVAFAKTNGQDEDQSDHYNNGIGWMMRHDTQGITGTVTAISGNTLTVMGRTFDKGVNALSYTVNASGAIVYKDMASVSLSAIAVSDMVFVEGTVNGTTVTATTIYDGVRKGMGRMNHDEKNKNTASTMPMAIHFDLVGTVTAGVNETSFSMKTFNGTMHTVNAPNATVHKNGASSTLTNVLLNDIVRIKGTVSGTTINATEIYDGTFSRGMGNTFTIADLI